MNNQNQISDMLFSSLRRLEAAELEEIETALAAMDCVISAHQGADHKHHFKVAYDPSCVDSHAILEKLKELGIDARMHGL
jgi:hypothetical protein